jgi:hypothetical protein
MFAEQFMELLADLAAWSVLAFSLLLFVSQWLVFRFGRTVGMWYRTARGTNEAEGVGVVVGGLLGLLAFILALTLSYSTSRFDERRAGALAEANAIGTAWLRSHAIDHPRAREIEMLIENYARVRKEFMLETRNSPAIAELKARSSALQSEIWDHLSAISRERSDPVFTSLMAALNDMFDMSAAEQFAFEARLAPQLFWLLIGMALISMAALGYQLGMKGHKMSILSALLIGVWTAVIVVILDLSAPRLGTFRTSLSVYDWTLQGFKGGKSIPPQPSVR